MTKEELKFWEKKKEETINRPWSDDGTDTEWDEETQKDWEEKMNSVEE